MIVFEQFYFSVFFFTLLTNIAHTETLYFQFNQQTLRFSDICICKSSFIYWAFEIFSLFIHSLSS